MKSVSAFVVGMTLAALLGWVARGRYEVRRVDPMEASRATIATPPLVGHPTPAAVAIPAERAAPLATSGPAEPPVSVEILAAIAPVPETPMQAEAAKVVSPARDFDQPRPMIVPVEGITPSALRDTFDEMRGDHRHEAIDILATRGTPVIAADDGVVKKLFTSVPGGLTIYEFDPDERFCYYYAHLDRYASDLHEGQRLRRGQIIGYVGTTGNASEDTPHLHFALIRLDLEKRWWKGTYVNPYPLLLKSKSP
jgi:murein DD-endopeptidase MepM/ murein hydrolase activator NlpD